MTKEQDTIFSQNSFPLIAGLTVAPTYAFLKSGDSYPPPRAATIPTVWLFCVHWLTLLAIYCRVLWLCPSRKAKSHKPLSWAGTTPGICYFGQCQSYTSRGALCPIILRALLRSPNHHRSISQAIQNWQSESKDFRKPPKTCWPCMSHQSKAGRMFHVPPKMAKLVATTSHRERCSMSANF